MRILGSFSKKRYILIFGKPYSSENYFDANLPNQIYQIYFQSQFSPAECLLLNLLIAVLRSIRRVNLIALATALPMPIWLESRRPNCSSYYLYLWLNSE